LEQISSPEDLRDIGIDKLDELANEIRQRIISVVSINGGHLASNLGVVELTIAMYRAFDIKTDKIVWDVGHQCYTHKMLTGRLEKFHTIRQYGGLSGFPRYLKARVIASAQDMHAQPFLLPLAWLWQETSRVNPSIFWQ